MNIVWHENPLKTRIELDDHEEVVFRLKYKLERTRSLARQAHYHLEATKIEHRDPEKAASLLKLADPTHGEDMDTECDELIAELDGQTHAGDCTCLPMTCSKCHAEYLAGIDTLEGLGKHESGLIFELFGIEGDKPIDAVISELASYSPKREGEWLKFPEEEFLKHLPRWREEAKAAHEWLVRYRAEKFSPQTVVPIDL